MTTLAYYVVDVFTGRSFAGNPLAVVLGAEDLNSAQLQALAREFNLSETAFPLRPSAIESARGVDYRLRIFTPVTELPFAGHPSVGAAWVLRKLGWFDAQDVTQGCGEGDLPLVVSPSGAELTGGRPCASGPIDSADALAAVGLCHDDLDAALGAPPRVCGTGISFAVLPVRPDALARCDPDPVGLRAFAHPISDATGVYVVAWDGSTATARARMFAGDIGVPEDAATGSAALALGVWLAVSDLVSDGSFAYTVLQGIEMGRPSRLECVLEVGDGAVRSVRVRGDVVEVAHGQIAIPRLN